MILFTKQRVHIGVGLAAVILAQAQPASSQLPDAELLLRALDMPTVLPKVSCEDMARTPDSVARLTGSNGVQYIVAQRSTARIGDVKEDIQRMRILEMGATSNLVASAQGLPATGELKAGERRQVSGSVAGVLPLQECKTPEKLIIRMGMPAP